MLQLNSLTRFSRCAAEGDMRLCLRVLSIVFRNRCTPCWSFAWLSVQDPLTNHWRRPFERSNTTQTSRQNSTLEGRIELTLRKWSMHSTDPMKCNCSLRGGVYAQVAEGHVCCTKYNFEPPPEKKRGPDFTRTAIAVNNCLRTWSKFWNKATQHLSHCRCHRQECQDIVQNYQTSFKKCSAR